MSTNTAPATGQTSCAGTFLLLIAMLLWFGFQTLQLLNERDALKAQRNSQEQIIVNSQKMRTQLDAIATGIKRLADQGNANAKDVVQLLAKNGIGIKPPTPTAVK